MTIFSLNSLLTKVKPNHKFSIIWINVIAISLSVATMLLSSFFINGFEQQIRQKVFNFWANIHILPYTVSNSTLNKPILLDSGTFLLLSKHKKIKSVHPIINKGVVVKSKENIEGAMIKGMKKEAMLQYEKIATLSSKYSNTSDESNPPLFLSNELARLLKTDTSKTILINYLDSTQVTKRAYVAGIFPSQIKEFDQNLIIAPIEIVRKWQKWPENQWSTVEIFIDNENDISNVADELYAKLPNVNVQTVYQVFPQLFDWLELMKQNETIIFGIMLIVALVNIISTLSIYVLERSRMVGILKMLGASNSLLLKFFYRRLTLYILLGIMIGNILAFGLGGLQAYFGFIKLDPEMYYLNSAPIGMVFSHILGINIVTFIVCMITLLIPLLVLFRISPVKVAEYR